MQADYNHCNTDLHIIAWIHDVEVTSFRKDAMQVMCMTSEWRHSDGKRHYYGPSTSCASWDMGYTLIPTGSHG